MGEAKRRRQSQGSGPAWAKSDDPYVQQMFENVGEPIVIALIGAGLIVPQIATLPANQLMLPQHRALRLAFSTFDRIRLGEITGQCSLCNTKHGYRGFSCYAVVERAAKPSKDGPKALVLPICHECDSVSTEETRRRVMALFPLGAALQEGTA